MAPEVDPNRCPLCGQPNACAMQAAKISGQAPQPCWCAHMAFSPELLARVPAQAKHKACICQACAKAEASAVTKPAATPQP